MCLLITSSLALVGASIAVAIQYVTQSKTREADIDDPRLVIVKKNTDSACNYGVEFLPDIVMASYCSAPASERFAQISGGFGGLNHSRPLANMSPDNLGNEFLSFSISNGAQFIFSLLYLMLIYNITLISQVSISKVQTPLIAETYEEQDWGRLEHGRKRIRSTLVEGDGFSQDYLLQLPKRILYPVMAYSVLTHWMLGEALQTQEAIWLEMREGRHVEHSQYIVGQRQLRKISSLHTLTDHLRCVSSLVSNVSYIADDFSMLVGLHTQAGRVHSTDVWQHQSAMCRDLAFG
ncbi:hypothetical protein NX059_009504 [Plenodomus lindquistii]|nr:hypothetical protein NX059_009504 [Plenodomus lindquistii]